jgi:hypothetical protein
MTPTVLGRRRIPGGRPRRGATALLASDLPSPTANTVTDPEVLRQEIARVREQGWAKVYERNEVCVRAVATVPRSGRRPASPSGPLARCHGRSHHEGELHGCVPVLSVCAEKIASLVG